MFFAKISDQRKRANAKGLSSNAALEFAKTS